jgi:hypothetical protein
LTKNEAVIGDFLLEIKDVVSKPISADISSWVFVPRQDNLDCLTELGLTFEDVKEIILELSIDDYCSGPVDDHNENGVVWIFGKIVLGVELYVKLKLAHIGNLKMVRVISLHKAKMPLSHPITIQESK